MKCFLWTKFYYFVRFFSTLYNKREDNFQTLDLLYKSNANPFNFDVYREDIYFLFWLLILPIIVSNMWLNIQHEDIMLFLTAVTRGRPLLSP